MDAKYMEKVEKKYSKRNPDVRSGDTVKVDLLITEGGKDRVQVFEGIVIAVKGTGLSKTITVRKISHGVGVEKILPINSPLIKKIDIVQRGNVRRSKLYYMRERIGKQSQDVGKTEDFEEILEDDGKEAVVEKGAEKKDVKKAEKPAEKKEKPAKADKKEESEPKKEKKQETKESKPEPKEEKSVSKPTPKDEKSDKKE